MKHKAKEKTADTRPSFFGIARWLSLGLIAVNVIIYAPVWHYGFVSFDDSLYVAANPNIASGLNWQSVWWALTTDRAGYWVPLTWLSQILDAQLFGLAAGPQHVTNALLHIASTLLLFGVLRRMTQGLWQSAFVAGLFAVHPLHVESVAWIAERKDVLSAMLWMLALWAYAVYASRPGLTRYFAVIVIFALALMAKPMAVTLPFVLLLLDVWPLHRVRLEAGQRNVWLGLVREKLPLFALAIASSLLTVVFTSRRGAVSGLDALPLTLRAANAVASYAAYLRDTLLPANLAAFYPYGSLSGFVVAGSVLVLIGVSLFVIRNARTHAYLLVGWFWYVGTLLPVVGLVQAGMQSRADRFTYIPLVGLFIMVAWGIPHILTRWRSRTQALTVAAVVLIGACTIIARRQVQYWENGSTLWKHALEVTNRNHVAHNVFGVALADEGKLDEAIAHYREALRIHMDYAEAHNNLGIALARQGRIDEAIPEFRNAIAVGNPGAETYYNLGFALAQQGKMDEALAQYSEALRVEPAYVAAHTKAGDALFNQGKINEAVARYNEALRIQPGFAVAHNNLGVALASQARYDEAIVHYTEALRIQPGLADAHNGLGAALANESRYGEAIVHFTEALRIQPDYSIARYNLDRVMQIQLAQPGAALTTSRNVSAVNE